MASYVSKAAVLPGFGQDLVLEDFEVPSPGQGAAIVEVAYGGVCGTDVHLRDGHLAIPMPVVLGHEGVGRVAALGPGVDRDALGAPLRMGDEVTWASSIACGVCFYCRQEREPTLCENRRVYGINRRAESAPQPSGSWAELQYLEPGSTIVRLPPGISLEAAIALGCAGPTAVHGVLGFVGPRVGDTVVVQGSGPVGLAAAMFARLAGAGKVVLVGGPRPRLELARALGTADAVIDIFETTDPAGRIEMAVGETPARRGADVVIEATGVPGAVAEGLGMCRPNARFLVLGQYTDAGPAEINPHLITRKQLALFGSWGLSGADVVDFTGALPQLDERFALSKLVSVYPLEDVNRALEDVRSGSVTKAILAPMTEMRGGRGAQKKPAQGFPCAGFVPKLHPRSSSH